MNDSLWLADFWLWLEYLPVAGEIGATWLFPFIESIHVITITFVVGSILMVDLRLLGLAGCAYPLTTISRELLPWTWAAFAIACITGVAMFITRAYSHVQNPAFQLKMLLLVLAGANMAIFHTRISRNVAQWDTMAAVPMPARVIGATSLLLWAGVMLAGRWIGHIV